MAIIESRLDRRSDTFARNRTDMLESLKVLEGLLAEAARGGGDQEIARLRARGKMPLRERISLASTATRPSSS